MSDKIFGEAGNDFLFGFEDYGVDFTGEPEDGEYDGDTIDGGAGNDFIIGYEGDDSLSGGSDDDIIRGNWGTDEIDGGVGSDAIEGGYHRDTITGGDGNDFLWGFEASQSVVDMHASTDAAKFKKIGALGYGENPWESNANEIDGGDGNDYLIGSGGDDTLTGGIGDDVIFGEYGRDTMTGGSGSDVFVFHGSWAYTVGANGDDDTITDFVSGEDQLLLSRPETPNSDPTSSYYQNPTDPYYAGFAWEFEASRIVFTYQEAFWNEDGEKEWVDREGAALHVNGGYDMSDIHYVDDFAFV